MEPPLDFDNDKAPRFALCRRTIAISRCARNRGAVHVLPSADAMEFNSKADRERNTRRVSTLGIKCLIKYQLL